MKEFNEQLAKHEQTDLFYCQRTPPHIFLITDAPTYANMLQYL